MTDAQRITEYLDRDKGKPFCECTVCGKTIYYGNDYYDFDDGITCKNCADELLEDKRRTAEEGSDE